MCSAKLGPETCSDRSGSTNGAEYGQSRLQRPTLTPDTRHQRNTSSCSKVLPVPGPGFRGRFWTGLGRKPNASGPNTSPKLPGPKPRASWDRLLVRLQHKLAQSQPPKPGPWTGNNSEQPQVRFFCQVCFEIGLLWHQADRPD